MIRIGDNSTYEIASSAEKYSQGTFFRILGELRQEQQTPWERIPDSVTFSFRLIPEEEVKRLIKK